MPPLLPAGQVGYSSSGNSSDSDCSSACNSEVDEDGGDDSTTADDEGGYEGGVDQAVYNRDDEGPPGVDQAVYNGDDERPPGLLDTCLDDDSDDEEWFGWFDGAAGPVSSLCNICPAQCICVTNISSGEEDLLLAETSVTSRHDKSKSTLATARIGLENAMSQALSHNV